MRFDIRAELLFFVSVIFFIFVLFYYTRILNRLLKLLRKPRFLSLLPLFSGILFLFVAIFHGIKMLYIYPLLAVSGLNLYKLLLFSFKITFLENLFFLIAGFFVFLTSIIYFAWLR
ncbi:MAG: hypothetical protein ABIM49_02580 [candidate division WOR-3 bacterium]|uniref:Uncharacterized protein n=1 Tax=candidate division WOR-3 bacterium TaxID=2052148 RepID=A0A7V3ZSY2_UNCW3